MSNPLKAVSHLQILKGNLAPEGAVAKITGKEGLRFSGSANVFDSEEDMLAALEAGRISKGEVIVIRYEGPKGRAGDARNADAHLCRRWALDLVRTLRSLRTAAFPAARTDSFVGHVTPEAQEGGPIALVENGDRITIDATTNEISLK